MTFFAITWWNKLEAWWAGTTIGQEVDSAAKAALSELEAIGPGALETVVEATASAILPGITGGASTATIIANGITAAEAAFKTAEASVSSTTVSTFVSALHSSISAQPVVAAPAPASDTVDGAAPAA
jgi:hypothetical protein